MPYGWTGTVRPHRNGYTFTPASRTYSNISASAAEQNYTAKLLTYTISGHVRDAGGAGAAGVVLLGLPGRR